MTEKKKLVIKRKEFLKWKLNDFLDKADFYEELIEKQLEQKGHVSVYIDDLLEHLSYLPWKVIANQEDFDTTQEEFNPNTYILRDFNVEWL